MPKLLFSAAILALFAGSALAQPDHHGPDGRNPGAAPHSDSHRGGDRGSFNRGSTQHGPTTNTQAAPPATARPQTLAQPQGNRGNYGRGNYGRDNNDRGNNWRDNNRHDNRPSNRAGSYTPPGHSAFRGNNDNRGGYYRPGRHRDFSSFRNYHRNYNSSRRFRAPAYRRPPGWSYRRWSFGQILPALFWSQQYWLSNYWAYDLLPPPPGAVWVRYGDDAMLIDRDTGEIITVQYGVFY